MSINIFQFLKQGTSLSSKSMQKNRKLQERVTPKFKTPNSHYFETGKFIQSQNEGEDKQKNQNKKTKSFEWQQLDEQKIKHQHNIKIQKCNIIRKQQKIKVEGTDIPLIVQQFEQIEERYKISHYLIDGLAQMGFKKPTAVQMQVIPSLLEHRNLLVTAPTGTGKTISYLLPLFANLLNLRQQKIQSQTTTQDKKIRNKKQNIQKCHEKLKFNKIQGLIIAPQQQLSAQIIHELEYLTKKYKQSKPSSQLRINFKQVSALNQEQQIKINKNQDFSVNILVVTPQTFINKFANNATKITLFSEVKYVILDQCDKYFQQSFIEQIRTILQFLSPIKPKPTYCLMSATIQYPVEQLLKSELLDDVLRVQVGGKNKVLTNVEQTVQYCTNQYGKILELKNMIAQNRFIPPAIIFVQQKNRAKQLYYQLKKIMKNGPAGLDLSKKIQVLTGDKSKEERKQILQKFQKGTYLILITTDLVARGIDFSHVNLVINYDFPNSMLTYIHRVGRTGRAQRSGLAVTFFTDEDKPIVKSLANLLSVSGCKVPSWILQLPNVDRKLKKKLQNRPIKRLPVGVSEGKDKNFDHELQRMQKIWNQKKKRQIQKQNKCKASNDKQQQSQWIQV